MGKRQLTRVAQEYRMGQIPMYIGTHATQSVARILRRLGSGRAVVV